MRGDARDELGQLDKAEPDYDAALKLDPNSADAYLARADHWYYNRHDTEKARADYAAAIRLRPGWSWAYIQRARLETNTSQYDAALKDLDLADANARGPSELERDKRQRATVYRDKGDARHGAEAAGRGHRRRSRFGPRPDRSRRYPDRPGRHRGRDPGQ